MGESAAVWVPIATLIVGSLIRLAKSDRAVAWFPVAISPRWRAWIALGLGVVLGVLQKLALGGSWVEAIGGGLSAGIAAITGHELIVESLRDGRDIGEAKRPPLAPGTLRPPTAPPISLKPPPLPPLAMLALVLLGCGPSPSTLKQSRELEATSNACRERGLEVMRRGGTCQQKRSRLLQMAETDPDCVGLFGDAGPGQFECRDGGPSDGGKE
jgi:hypothetical protein